MNPADGLEGEERVVHIAVGSVTLEGALSFPDGTRGVVLFAHGSGSSRHSPRNRYVAQLLNNAKLATLLVDLLTAPEEVIDQRTAHLRRRARRVGSGRAPGARVVRTVPRARYGTRS